MTSDPPPTFAHHGADHVEEIIDQVVTPLYVATHADVIHDPFYGAERFVDRVRGYARAPGFEIVIARVNGEPVGQAFGYSLPEGARWWEGLTTPTEPEMIT